MKLFLDFLPIVAFVGAYFMTRDIYYATAWLIVGSALLVTGNWLIFRKVEKMHLFTFILLLVFGGATLLFRQPLLIQWKPTIATWLLALVCLGSRYIGKKPLMERIMGSKIELPREIWLKVTDMWAIFFLFSGAANLFVFTQFSESAWVAFKLYGQLSLTIIFLIFQAIYLSRHMNQDSKTPKT